MDTEKTKFVGGSQKKGGKDTTQVILTAAGAAVAGAGGALGATELLKEKPVEEVENTVDEAQQAATQQAGAQQAQTAQTQQQQPQQPAVATDEIQPVDSAAQTGATGQTVQADTTGQTVQTDTTGQTAQTDTVQPTDGGQTDVTTNDVPAGQSTGGHDNNPAIDDVNPDLIAQEITATEVDPNDVDIPDMVYVDDIDTLFFEDGSEMPVAMVHTPDGGEYLMVDVDNDLTFDVVTDLEGNPVTAVEGNMTLSDLEDMMDDTGDVLAYDPEQDDRELIYGEDPEEGIVDTDADGNYLAYNDRGSSDDREDDEEEAEEEAEEDFEDEDDDDDMDNDLAMGDDSDADLYVDDI